MANADQPLSDDDLDRLESEFIRLAFGPGAERSDEVDWAAEYARAGLPRTLSRDHKLVCIYPDGREEVLHHLPPVEFQLPPGVKVLDATTPGPFGPLAAVRDRLRRELIRREEAEAARRTGAAADAHPSNDWPTD